MAYIRERPGYNLVRYHMQPLWRTDGPLTWFYRTLVTLHFAPTGTFPLRGRHALGEAYRFTCAWRPSVAEVTLCRVATW